MPEFDGTGPRGTGPGTGWSRGPCSAGLRRSGGRTLGRGAFGQAGWEAGRGRTRPRWRYGPQESGPFRPAGTTAPGTSQDEVAALKMELAIIQQRLATLENFQP
jgi:hypothetical protein